MAFIEEGETPVPGNPAGFMAYHISIGTSANQALVEWRELGGTSGRSKWLEMYGQVTDTIMRTENHAALDPAVLPSASDYGEWAMGAGGQYATQVNVAFVDKDTGEAGFAPFTYVSDEPHTPAEAEQAAMDEYGSDENADRYGQAVTGAFVTHVWQTVPFAA